MELRPYQRECLGECWDWLCGNQGNPLLVLPTGSGKSWICGQLAVDAVQRWGGQAMIMAHRKELLEQNMDKLRQLAPSMPVGFFSASLNRRCVDDPVIVGQIQSCYDKAYSFGQRNLVIVDEAHLVNSSEGTMYAQFLSELRTANPSLRVVGLTATPYRMATGCLVEDENSIWHAIAYTARIPELIAAGYLSPLRSGASKTEFATADLHTRSGEFVTREQADLFGQAESLGRAIVEIVQSMRGRRSILVFCVSIDHAMSTAQKIAAATGEQVEVVTGKTPSLLRSATLEQFKQGSLRWLVNCDVLTTGFDAPNIDGIAILRATQSPGLFAQICGRGFRLSPGKEDCLILDFGGNVDRHGPLDAPNYGRLAKRSKKEKEADGPQKTCPGCRIEIPLEARTCQECGFRFPADRERERGTGTELSDQASNEAILQTPESWEVTEVSMVRHKGKEGKPDTLRVTYEVEHEDGGSLHKFFSEWVCIEHTGYARTKAEEWFRMRCNFRDCPKTIEEVIALSSRMRSPRMIETVRDGKFFRLSPISWDPWQDVFEQQSGSIIDEFEDVPF